MTRKFLKKTIFYMILFIGLFANAQDVPVKGRVTSTVDGQTIPGVNITVDGTNKSTTTDLDGSFIHQCVKK